MEENADGTGGEEAFRLLARGEDFRIGMSTEPGAAVPPRQVIEFLLRLFRTGMRLGPKDLERALELVKRLTCMGYSIFFLEDGWVACEKTVGNADAGSQARILLDMLGGR